MIERQKWFDHKFNLGIDIGWTENIYRRLRDTEIVLVHHTANQDETTLARRHNDTWSVKEHIGHLTDLEALWQNRFLQFEAFVPELVEADLTNQKTEEAAHNDQTAVELIHAFKKARAQLLTTIEGLGQKAQLHEALHPRLKIPMRPVDLMFFVAEHDTHHLTSIVELLNRV